MKVPSDGEIYRQVSEKANPELQKEVQNQIDLLMQAYVDFADELVEMIIGNLLYVESKDNR